MATLTLVRHGQAAADIHDYDHLSPLGVEQARALGAHLATRAARVDVCVSGPRRRQLDTLGHLAATLPGCPAAQVVEAWDEFPFVDVLRAGAATVNSQPGEGSEPPRRAHPSIAAGQDLGQQFWRSITAWARGELRGDFESYADFRARVLSGLGRVVDEAGRGARVLVVTSGGPIAVVLRETLGIDAERSLAMQAVTANASMTELRFRPGQLSLMSWNQTAHLAPKLVTVR